MSNSPTNAGNAGAEDAKAAKRAEIERRVAEARALQAQEKTEKDQAALIEARKQAQIRELLLQAQSDKDERFARVLAEKEAADLQAKQRAAAELQAKQRELAFIARLRAQPLEALLEIKVSLPPL